MSVHVMRGDARRIPLRDASVDLIVTSPPYYSLRDYGIGGQVGSEPTPAAFLEVLWAVTAEMVRVLKPSGSIFVNLGDSYAARANAGPSSKPGSSDGVFSRSERPRRPSRFGAVRAKSLHGLPWAYALGCTGMLAALGADHIHRELVRQLGKALMRDVALGALPLAEAEEALDEALEGAAGLLGGSDPGLNLILRASIVWHKPSAIPESSDDRVRTSDREDWFHLVKSPRYYAAVDELREPRAPQSIARMSRNRFAVDHSQDGVGSPNTIDPRKACHPLGKLPGSVWSIPAEPLRLPPWVDAAHYAAFPTRWPEQLIKGWSPPGICVECGRGRFPVVSKPHPGGFVPDPSNRVQGASQNGAERNRRYRHLLASGERPTILGYACACTPATWHPGTGERSPTAREDGRQGERPVSDLGARHHRVRGWWEYHLDRWAPPPTRPAVVLDCFGGTGTTAHVAHALGRIGISLDLSEAYCRLAADRTLAAQRAAKVHGRVNKERQLDLFGGVA